MPVHSFNPFGISTLVILLMKAFISSPLLPNVLALPYWWDDNLLLRKNLCPTTRHVHLSTWHDASSSITISFSSHPCDMPNEGDWNKKHFGYEALPPSFGAVLIGTDPHSYDSFRFVKGGHPQRYNATVVRGTGRYNYWSEYQHHITVHDLDPDTTYFYKCVVMKNENLNPGPWKEEEDGGDADATEEVERILKNLRDVDKELGAEHVFKFRTGPALGTHSRTKMAFIGDLGLFPHTKRVLSVLGDEIDDVDSVTIVGDLAYANSEHPKWDLWFDMMDATNILHKKPIYIAAGNHDAEGNLESGALFQNFENRFKMPHVKKAILGRVTKEQDLDKNKMYKLPYDYGNSFYSYYTSSSLNIVLNSFADFEPGSNQYNWLVEELNSVDRDITPWVIVTVHCPMYNTFSLHSNDPQPKNMKKFLEPVFIEHRVNFIISGHLHAYFRSKNVANDELVPTGPIHIILGNGGRQANAPFRSDIPEEWVAVRDHTTYGYGTIEFLNATFAKYETCHNEEGDKGFQYVSDAPKNLTDVVFVENQYYL